MNRKQASSKSGRALALGSMVAALVLAWSSQASGDDDLLQRRGRVRAPEAPKAAAPAPRPNGDVVPISDPRPAPGPRQPVDLSSKATLNDSAGELSARPTWLARIMGYLGR